MRVMVTGAAGLLGTWLRRTAPPDVQLVLAVRETPPADLGEPVPPVQVQVDLTDADAVNRAVAEAACDLVLHAAYRIDDEPSVIAVTDHVVAATVRHGADLVMMSSDAVFAGDGRRRTETDRPDPVSDYGRWKAAAERRARTGVPNAAPAVLVRPTVVDGPGGPSGGPRGSPGALEAWGDPQARLGIRGGRGPVADHRPGHRRTSRGLAPVGPGCPHPCPGRPVGGRGARGGRSRGRGGSAGVRVAP